MKYVINDTTLTAIGDAVREKSGTADKILVKDIPASILAIETGGGGGAEIPDEAFVFSGDCTGLFRDNKWSWFVNEYGEKLSFNEVTTVNNMFQSSTNLVHLPFDINLSTATSYSFGITSFLMGCSYLETLPTIKGALPLPTGNYTRNPSIQSVFSSCKSLKHIPYDWFNNWISEEFAEEAKKYNATRGGYFNGCHSLRSYPDISRVTSTLATINSGKIYYNLFRDCYSLDEIIDLPVLTLVASTGSQFNSTFTNCARLKRLTFETNTDGSAIVAPFKNDTIDLSDKVGYSQFTIETVFRQFTDFTDETLVKDDASYQALKDNPDYWTLKPEYSRYNHDSAVETINSLPDASANGGCVIKFKGAAGSATDGGAINTLTEEEIAVAAAKGWTVTLVQEAQGDETNKL